MRIQLTNRWLVIVLLFFLVFDAQAQIWLDNESIYDEAEEFLISEEYIEALPLFLLLEKKGIINAQIAYKIGECYMHILGKQYKAISYLEMATKDISDNYVNSFIETTAPARAYLLLGLSFAADYQFDKALDSFSEYKKLVAGTIDEQIVDFQILKCKIAKRFVNNPTDIEFNRLAEQSEFPVYNPVVGPDNKIYFMEKQKFYDAIIEATLQDNSISNTINLTPKIGSDGDVVIIDISPEGDRLIFRMYNGEQGYDLFYSDKDEKGKWQKMTAFPSPINTPHSEYNACIGSNNQVLYFTSNRPGTIGGLDIYIAKYDTITKKWSNPQNLGATINTTLNESFVNLSHDMNKLYFSSAGHLNMGYEDLFFSTRKTDGTWAVPINMGSPVSTPGDDIFIHASRDTTVFYLYQIARLVDDKYRIYKAELKSEINTPKILVTGIMEFTDRIPPAQVTFDVVEANSGEVLFSETTDSSGNYKFELDEGDYSINFKYNELITANKDISLSKKIADGQYTVVAPEWNVKVIEQPKPEVILYLTDVLFAFNSSDIATEYKPMLDSIVEISKNNDSIQIQLTGHTDILGSSIYNQMLSEHRAKVVKKYLINLGVDTNQIITVGKGEDYPVATSKTPQGSDNKTGRKYNRRVTIDIHKLPGEYQVIRFSKVPEELKVE